MKTTLIILNLLSATLYASTKRVIHMVDQQTLHQKLVDIGQQDFDNQTQLSHFLADKEFDAAQITAAIEEHFNLFLKKLAQNNPNAPQPNSAMLLFNARRGSILKALLQTDTKESAE